MAADKTGVLTRMSVKLSCIKLNVSEELTDKLSAFGEKLGVAFQIQDVSYASINMEGYLEPGRGRIQEDEGADGGGHS